MVGVGVGGGIVAVTVGEIIGVKVAVFVNDAVGGVKVFGFETFEHPAKKSSVSIVLRNAWVFIENIYC
jgi:hypothetical protein